MDDAGIIELYWSRDERAIDETRARYGGLVGSLAMNMLANREDAEECVQDTLLALWNAIPPARPCDLKAYLGRTARNIAAGIWARAHAKKRDAGLTVMLRELEDALPAAGDAQSELEDRELGRVISEWLRSLPAGDRALFLRRYWYGQELRKIAREWGVPANTLAQRVYRLRLSLRKALEKEDLEL